MLVFLNLVLTECYVNRQPELLCALYDELHQAAQAACPPQTLGLITQAAPKSVMAVREVKQVQVKSKVKVSKKSFKFRPKSFNTSLMGCPIDLAAGRKGQKVGKHDHHG